MKTAARLLLALCSLAVCVQAHAQAPSTSSGQAYPSKSIRFIIPFAPGGPTDTQARWAGQQLNAAFGQPVIMENRAGAGGVPGTELGVKSPPDGYTLVAGNPGPLTIAPSALARVPYDPLRDLAPIILIAKTASCLTTHPSLPAKGIREFIALAKTKPGQINYGTPGVGTVGHFAIELFATQAGVKLNHVPYKGAAQYVVDLLAGNIELALVQFAQVLPLVRQNRLRCLGATSPGRSPLLPDVPSISEQGLKGFESYNWNGVLAPAATPRAIIVRVHDVLAKQLATPEARELYASQGHEPGSLGMEDYAAFMRTETVKWAKVGAAAGIPKQ